MKITDIPVPEAYKESYDFRFFLKWVELCFTQLQYDIENLVDLLDPERCPEWLVWLLGDTMGYKYDDRVITSVNRLVMLYFMSLIRNKGSRTGMMLAAEVNLAQFNLTDYAKENEVYENRIADTSIPVNSVYVTPHTEEGYIDVVYFSDRIPVDICTEYVRPLGMYMFTHAGVRIDSRTKISVDARLTDSNCVHLDIGPTRIGHYRRDDYASLQRMINPISHNLQMEKRHPVYYRNSKYEGHTSRILEPGYRSLYSLQISNNEHIVKSLIQEPIFSIGFGPQDVSVRYPDNYYKNSDRPEFNLRYDRDLDRSISEDTYVNDADRTTSIVNPRPAVNPVMSTLGDAISLNDTNTKYTKYNEATGKIDVVDIN